VVFLGCNSQEQSVRLANEVNDLKVEVFRQRQEIQELVKKREQEEKNTASERATQNQFRADTQETLRQIREDSRTTANRLNSNNTVPQRTNTQTTTRQPARPAAEPAPPEELEPDHRQYANAEKDYNSGNYARAADAADHLIKYFPDSEKVPDALYLKGRALMATNSFAEAQKSFQQIWDNYPELNLRRVAKLNIGRCQLRQNNIMAAIGTFQEIVSRWPTSPEAKQASEILEDVQTGR
jgi:TolA-binding protein